MKLPQEATVKRDRERRQMKEKRGFRNFPRGPVVKNPPCSAGNAGLIPSWGTKIPPACGATKAVFCNGGGPPHEATKIRRSQIHK